MNMKIDKHLDNYASERYGHKYKWWWNGDSIIGFTIASCARHIRKDGCHDLTENDRKELKRLEHLAKVYADNDCSFPELDEDEYKYFMELFAKWLPRLWD